MFEKIQKQLFRLFKFRYQQHGNSINEFCHLWKLRTNLLLKQDLQTKIGVEKVFFGSHVMLLQNRIHWLGLYPKRLHFEHYEWCIVFASDMKWATDTMACHTIPLQSFFSKISKKSI